MLNHDEICRWPAELFNRLLATGILRELSPRSSAVCSSCHDHEVEVLVRDLPANRRAHAMCPECGLVEVPLERLRWWCFSFEGLASAVASACGAGGGVSLAAGGHLAFLGIVQRPGSAMDLFLGRGLAPPDPSPDWSASDVLRSCPRYRSSARPAVLTLANLPPLDVPLPSRPALGSLTELSDWSELGLIVDAGPLWAQPTIPDAQAGAAGWISVTDAAKQLMTVIDDLDLVNARARISMSANRSKFKTNGLKGSDRRIDRDSFSTWLFEERDRSLNEADPDKGDLPQRGVRGVDRASGRNGPKNRANDEMLAIRKPRR